MQHKTKIDRHVWIYISGPFSLKKKLSHKISFFSAKEVQLATLKKHNNNLKQNSLRKLLRKKWEQSWKYELLLVIFYDIVLTGF